VDSSDPKKHDPFRGKPGPCDRTAQALSNSVELKTDARMATLMSKEMEALTTALQYARVYLSFDGGPLVPVHFYIRGDNTVKPLAEFIGVCGAGKIYAGLQSDGEVIIPCVLHVRTLGKHQGQAF